MTGDVSVHNAVLGTVIMLLIMCLLILKESSYHKNFCLCYDMLIFMFPLFMYSECQVQGR